MNNHIKSFVYSVIGLGFPVAVSCVLNTFSFMPVGWPWVVGIGLSWLFGFSQGRFTKNVFEDDRP